MMKLSRLLCFLAFIAAQIFAPALAQAAEHLSLSADSVKFYGDRFLLEADGNVSILLDHRYQLTGHAFSMDMRLNRFVIAGDVHLTGPGVQLQGAGLADFLETQRIYFVPLLEQPDRWTFENMDFARPFKGREMPGDPFFLPDVSDSRVTVKSTHVEIEPLSYMRFTPAQVLSVGLMLPVPSFILNFSPDPDFRQNSLAGAIQDAPYDFFGGTHTLSTVHLRYDQTNKAYLAFEQHYASRGGWTVASINPLTRPIKQYNVIGLGRFNDKSQVYGFFQAISFQKGFSAPYQLSAFTKLQFTHVLRQSFLQLDLNQSWDSLLIQPTQFEPTLGYYYYGDPTHAWVPMHPFNGQLTWQGLDHPIGRLPLSFRLSSSFGFAHDSSYDNYSYGLTSFDGKAINSLTYQTVGAVLYSKPIKLGANSYLNFSVQKLRQWYSLPHFTDSVASNISISKTVGSKLALYGGYSVTNIADYWGSKQLQYYTPTVYTSPDDGQIYSGFSAFRGFATYRYVYASAVYAPTPDFTFNLLLRKNTDFPQPIPGVLGNPPYQAFGDVRMRLSPHVQLDVSRSYSFQFGKQGWSPTFNIQVLP